MLQPQLLGLVRSLNEVAIGPVHRSALVARRARVRGFGEVRPEDVAATVVPVGLQGELVVEHREAARGCRIQAGPVEAEDEKAVRCHVLNCAVKGVDHAAALDELLVHQVDGQGAVDAVVHLVDAGASHAVERVGPAVQDAVAVEWHVRVSAPKAQIADREPLRLRVDELEVLDPDRSRGVGADLELEEILIGVDEGRVHELLLRDEWLRLAQHH